MESLFAAEMKDDPTIRARKKLGENKKVWEEYKGGKKESLNFLIGCVMKLSNRRADFNAVRNIFEEKK
jgi:Asp-tRNA(Asn)/Glu-tRNA(Gln) amidotransferase B subunit